MRIKRILIVLALVLNFGLFACAKGSSENAQEEKPSAESHEGKKHAEEVKLSPEAVQKYGIRSEKAQMRVLRPVFIAPARVSFNAEAVAHVGSPLRGRVAEMAARLGDSVEKGGTLLVIESPELGESQSEFLQKRIAAEAAAPAVDLAKNAFERAKGLYEKDQGIALTEVQKREIEYRSAQAGLQMAKSSATAAENKLHLLGMDQKAVEDLIATGEVKPKFEIRAPISGQVVEREVTLGELVGPDKESLLVLANLSALWILAEVPEAKLGEIGIGSKARIIITSSQKETLEGTIAFISPMLDPSTRTAHVRFEIKGGPSWMRPGMFARAEIETGSVQGMEPVLAVPEEAIQSLERRTVVFCPVAGEENTFAPRPVLSGPAVGGWVPVYSGLKEEEVCVVSGSFILKAEIAKASAEHED